MSSFGITKCDVPFCTQSYQIEYGKSLPPNHERESWLTVNGMEICPTHGTKIREAVQELQIPKHR